MGVRGLSLAAAATPYGAVEEGEDERTAADTKPDCEAIIEM